MKIKSEKICAVEWSRRRSYPHTLSTHICSTATTLFPPLWKWNTSQKFLNDLFCDGTILPGTVPLLLGSSHRRSGPTAAAAFSLILFLLASTILYLYSFRQNGCSFGHPHQKEHRSPPSDKNQSDKRCSVVVYRWKRTIERQTDGSYRHTAIRVGERQPTVWRHCFPL